MLITAALMEKADGALTKRRIVLEQLALDEPRNDEVLIRITSCGVCGTDRGIIHGLEPTPTPCVLGHEGAGIVEAVGSDVSLVEPGDRVMIGFPFCGHCRSCRRGDQRYCENGASLAFSGRRMDGSGGMRRQNGEEVGGRFFQQSSWSTRTIALEHQLAKVPEAMNLDLAGPLGCSISTGAGTVLNELRPHPGSSIAIFGVGNVGLAAVMAARLTGATKIIAIDKEPARLALARELGATHSLKHNAGTAAELKAIVGEHLDFSIEATDGANLVEEAVTALGFRGTCAMVGGAKLTETIKARHGDVLTHGKRIIGVMGGGGQTPEFLQSLMELHIQGRFPLEKLVKFYDFKDVNQAINDSDSGLTVKPVLLMPAH